MNKCIIDFYHNCDRNRAIDIALMTFNVSPLDIIIKQRPVIKYNNRLIINFEDVYQTGAFINHITNDRIHLSVIRIRKKRYLKKFQGISREN